MINISDPFKKIVPNKTNPIFLLYSNSGLIDNEGFIKVGNLWVQAINHNLTSFFVWSINGKRLPTSDEADNLIKKNLDYLINVSKALGWYELGTAMNFNYRFWTKTETQVDNALCFHLNDPIKHFVPFNKGNRAWTLYVKEVS